MRTINIVENIKLKQHEKINKKHLEEVLKGIRESGFIRDPIVVDRKTNIILDGHHRYNVIKLLGLNKSPVIFVEYLQPKIQVKSWRKDETVTKDDVLIAGLTGKLLKPKTSRHIIPNKPKNSNILLTTLK